MKNLRIQNDKKLVQNAEPVTVQANNMTARVKDDFRPNLMKNYFISLFLFLFFKFNIPIGNKPERNRTKKITRHEGNVGIR